MKKPNLLNSLKFMLAATLPVLLFACTDAETVNSANTTNTSSNTQNVDVVQASTSHDTSHIQPNAVHTLNGISATVYKDPNCGCCTEWVDYAQNAGMHAIVEQPENLSAIKDTHGIPNEMRSCHLAVTNNGYVFEGHVPAKFIAQFLTNPPEDAIGLSVPGMPVGSPGMEYDNKFMAYDVYQLNVDGSTNIYAHVASPTQQL